MRSIFIITFSVLCLIPCTLDVWAGAGKTGAEFLLIGAGARPTGMGGTFVAISDDINAIYWNPAGLALIKRSEITATHTEWLSDIRYDLVGYGYPVPGLGTFGIGAVYLNTGDIEGRSLSGKKIGDFRAYDVSTSFSFGREVSRNISFGTTLKFIQQVIENEQAYGVALDLGGLYNATEEISLGMSLLNIGPSMKFIKEEYSLPLALNLGVGYRFISMVTLALDVKHQLNDRYTSLSIGTEYMMGEFLTLRGGYLMKAIQSSKSEIQNEEWTDFEGLGAGIGFRFRNYQFDYSFVPFAELGNTHRMSFIGRF